MTDNTQDNAAQQPPAQDTSTSTAKEGSSNGAIFTQAQVNEMIGRTRKEARDTTFSDVLKELGVASKDELKALKAERDALKTSQMSDAEKLQAERDQAKKEKEDALALVATIQAERRNDRIQSAFTRAANDLKAQDVEDVWRYARDKHADDLNALADETGKVDEAKVKALLEKIKTAKVAYFTPPITTPGSMSNNGGRITPNTGQTPVKRQHTAI